MFNSATAFNIQNTHALPAYRCPGIDEELDADLSEIEVTYIDDEFDDVLVRWVGGAAHV